MRSNTFLLFIILLFGNPGSPLAEDVMLHDPPPLRVGWTFQKSPLLYYFISEVGSLPLHFALRDERSEDRPLELLLPNPTTPGFHAIRLEDYNIELERGVQYRWLVFVKNDKQLLQRDVLAEGVIERPGEEMFLIDMTLGSCSKEEVRELLLNNFWYDGAACLHELIQAQPHDGDLLLLRDRVYREQPFQRMDSVKGRLPNQ